MPEEVITIIFSSFALADLALLRGRLTAVLYYICVATLSYFSFWMFVTWEPDRVCGALLALAGLFCTSNPRVFPKRKTAVLLFFAYVVILTLISSFLGDRAMSGRSAAYGPLRVYVQISTGGDRGRRLANLNGVM